MTDPLKLADKLDYEGGSLVLHTTDDVGETIHRISIPAELVAAALRLAEAADDNDFPLWPRDMDGEPVRGATLSERVCPYCEEIRGDGHARTCPVAAYRAAREGS